MYRMEKLDYFSLFDFHIDSQILNYYFIFVNCIDLLFIMKINLFSICFYFSYLKI